jgi:hypothetical protein
MQASAEMHDGVFVRSVYFFDPDGVCLEFASWTKTFDESDVAHEAVRADGTRARNVVLKAETMLAENDVKALEPAK